ncbi:MAG: peptidyl-prolyl cis-trans isomerase [Phycisphaerales bacterium]|nr:peptidyl-prolyl cis-trans isomerase [Phycisphaerales bacterium]
MNLQDATFPAALRQAVSQLEVGQVSDPVALDSGFAVLKLERKNEGAGLKLTDVKEELEMRVTRQMQQMLMQRLAREVVLQSDLVIMDPALSKSYAQAKAALLGGN